MGFYLSGSYSGKLDDKNRMVLAQELRYGLVENGELEFVIALGSHGCLTIYKKSEMDRIVERFRAKQHIAKYRKFFTLFFATLFTTDCDKVGRFTIPQHLKDAAKIKSEVVLVGVIDRIEIWSKEAHQNEMNALLQPKGDAIDMASLMEEIFNAPQDEEEIVV
ncbi:MAG: division/cell wall cluster transcriptional repressor MraZ [Chlamydiae bacterium]|jgi:MraZ protein|nr:division/cell wall cluster transcriptional repressor MraZ [Chlamydiota bacterium]